MSANFKTGKPVTASPVGSKLKDEDSLICPSQQGWISPSFYFGFWVLQSRDSEKTPFVSKKTCFFLHFALFLDEGGLFTHSPIFQTLNTISFSLSSLFSSTDVIKHNLFQQITKFTFLHLILSLNLLFLFCLFWRDKYGVQLKLDLSFEYVNAVVCLWGESRNGWRGSVSVPYSWFQGEFDSFSSVTLKVSFPTPGFYQRPSLTAPSCFLQEKKRRGGKRKMPQSSVN